MKDRMQAARHKLFYLSSCGDGANFVKSNPAERHGICTFLIPCEQCAESLKVES